MYTAFDDRPDGTATRQKIGLYYAYMGIIDPVEFWREAKWTAKAKVITVMFLFNFILLYHYFTGKPLIAESSVEEQAD